MFLLLCVTSLCLVGARRIPPGRPLEGSTNGDISSHIINTETLVESGDDVISETVNDEAIWSITELPDAGVPRPHELRFPGPRGSQVPAPLILSSRARTADILSSMLTENDVPKVFQCGVRPVSRERIAGGFSSTTRWPWMVQILRKENRELICGATLISGRHVITAGHCIRGVNGEYSATDLIIRIGDHYQNEIEAQEQDVDIECMFVHPNFNPSTLKNDIAVLKLKVNEKNPINFSSDLLPVCLPNKREFKMGTNCYVTGWGYRDFIDFYYDISSPTLTEAKVPLISNRDCRNIGRIYETDVTKKMQCAGYLTGQSRADTCKKDSGGPLVCQNKEGVWKLWGITSWGDNTFCETEPDLSSPGVYTRVDKYFSWINIKLDQTCPK